MALFAAAKEPFLRGSLKLKHGVPSHDTSSRLFRFLDPTQFRTAFSSMSRRARSSRSNLWSMRIMAASKPGRLRLQQKKIPRAVLLACKRSEAYQAA
jgi:hypothetical protein